MKVEIVRWSDQAKALVVLPRRSLVERTLAWLGRCRRLAKDWEARRSLRLASLTTNSQSVIDYWPSSMVYVIANLNDVNQGCD